MNFRLETIQNTFRLVKPKRMGLVSRLTGVLACALMQGVNAADITVAGLDDVIKGTVYAEVMVDEPITEVKMEIPGVVNRIEKHAPYGLMSDKAGKLNPLDTTKFDDGDYVLTVTATLEDGSEAVETFSFKINNILDAPSPAKATELTGIDLSSVPGEVYVGQTITVPTGLEDGSVVWYHLFDKQWGDLIRSNVKVQDGHLELTIPDTSGKRILQLQHKRDVKVRKNIKVSANKPAEPDVTPAPTPEPEPTPEPTPDTDTDTDPEPKPEVDVMSIDMASIPASLAAGQQLSVDVTGIEEGESVYVHLFDTNWGDLIRSNAKVTGGRLTLRIPETSGDRILQLQYENSFKAHKVVSVGTPTDGNTETETETETETDTDSDTEGNDTDAPADPEASPAPAPEVVQPSIDLSVVGSNLAVGQRISVPLQGIEDGEQLFFHLFDGNWGDLIRRNVTVKDSKVELHIPDVSGKRILQLQYQNLAKASKTVNVSGGVTSPNNGAESETSTPETDPSDPSEPETDDPTSDDPVANDSDPTGGDADSTEDSDADPTNDANPADDTTPDAPADTPTLVPGSGWYSATNQPGQVGNSSHPGYPYSAIARWAVVPHQVFKNNFTIGVAAFHSYGIDRVAFSVDNGPWVSVDQMKQNPRTRADEYFVNLDADKFSDGKVVVRAIAYPHHGVPRVLEDLELFANAGGSLSFPVIELDAGKHKLSGLSNHMPEQGWLTVRPKPGVAKEDCIVTEIDRVHSDRRVKIQGVTITHNGGNDLLYGLDKKAGWVWLDDVKVVGNGRAHMTAWLVHLWGRQFYTDCDISKVQNVFHGGGGGLFARNINIHDTYEDVFRAFGYVANVTIDGVDRGDTNFHPDIFEFTVRWPQQNVIFHNIKVSNAGAQGMAGGLIRDLAMVNVDIETHGKAVMQIGMELTNVLIQDSRFAGGARLRDAEPNGFVIRDSVIGWKAPLYLPDNWDQDGVTVLPAPPLYD